MKTIDKKLSLKKKTIAILSNAQSLKIRGGGEGDAESSLSIWTGICCTSLGISECNDSTCCSDTCGTIPDKGGNI